MKFELKASETNDLDNRITHEFVAITLTELLERLEAFIKAAGFSYRGELNIYDESLDKKPKEGVF